MKRLTRVKLINWHRFNNVTLEISNTTLLSGENGAGKSTLLDAIQFVVTSSASNFNKAAHENGKRRLTGYIRCKTGKEEHPYERTGEISAHVALEFYEERRKKYFIVGAVVDSASEGQEKTARYLMDDRQLEEDMFFQGNVPRSISQFRTYNAKKIRQWCTTEKEGRSMVKNRFGRLEDKFFRLIPKALAFRPIDDIKDFVYSYVLDEKEVNIDVLRENVRSYQDFQRTLENVRTRIEKLEKIVSAHEAVEEGLKKDSMYEYFLARAREDRIAREIDDANGAAQSARNHLEEEMGALRNVRSQQEEKQQIRDDLRTELASDKDFIAKTEQEKRKRELELRRETLQDEKKELLKSVQKALRQLEKLIRVSDADPCLDGYFRSLESIAQNETELSLSEVRDHLEKALSYKDEMRSKLFLKQAELKQEEQKLSREKQETEQKIALLQKKKLSYPAEVERLLLALRDDFTRIGRTGTPRVLCELLEITDDAWRNAVEGYLNTQRFYILTDPGSFDIALGTYDALRRDKKAAGVGLINTQKLDEYDTAPEGSLASVVTSKNKYAKRYINMVLGKVALCSHYSDLKKHKTGITRECMRYQNHVASAIRPEIYETPFIGQRALQVQLEQAKGRSLVLAEKIRTLGERLQAMEEILEPLGTRYDTDIKYRLDVLSRLWQTDLEIRNCEDNIATLEKNSGMIMKHMQLTALDGLLRDLQEEYTRHSRNVGTWEEKIRSHQETVRIKEKQREEQHAECLELGAKAGEVLNIWDSEYEKRRQERDTEAFIENYQRTRKANQTVIDREQTSMKETMMAYKTAHDFGAAASMEGYPEFEAEWIKLRDSELLKYEEKVNTAREAAEEEFREQFLSKLQENMKIAQNEFKELNRALKDIHFSSERYEFLFLPSRKYRSYYDMIMDDFNAVQGESIFSGIFHETHKAVIEELFERLALDRENDEKALDEFTDYRTYMDYDIRILHNDGSYSLYSKVCEEKSGGETQTPFYVTVAASFVQLYRNNIGGEAVGLVMFDEAFNNMDDERIGGVLEFLRRLPLQILIAAPPDKIQYISPYMDETLLIMTDEKVSFAEGYYRERK